MWPGISNKSPRLHLPLSSNDSVAADAAAAAFAVAAVVAVVFVQVRLEEQNRGIEETT